MNQKLGLTSYAFYWAGQETNQPGSCETVLNLLEKTSTMGLEVFQVCENLPLHSWDEDDLKRLGAAAQGQDMILEVGTRGLAVENLCTHIKISNTLGAHILRLTPWSGSEARQPFPIDTLYEVIHPLLPLCREFNVTLAIENYFDLPDQELASFIQQMNDPYVGVCLDTANSAGLLEKPLQTVELLAPFVVSLHLKDFVVRKPSMGYVISGVPLGRGWLDAQAVLDVIHKADRHPNILLELWVDPDESKEATLLKEEMWVRQSVDFARHHLSIGSVQKLGNPRR